MAVLKNALSGFNKECDPVIFNPVKRSAKRSKEVLIPQSEFTRVVYSGIE